MKSEYIINRQGKDFVLYEGLLDEAHRQGLTRISTTLIQAPSDGNGQIAICRAEVETTKGTFSGIGDASPTNVNRMIAPHLIRMAETRAKARALRDAINIGAASLEELGPEEAEEPTRSNGHGPTPDNLRMLDAAQQRKNSGPPPDLGKRQAFVKARCGELAKVREKGETVSKIVAAAMRHTDMPEGSTLGSLSHVQLETVERWIDFQFESIATRKAGGTQQPVPEAAAYVDV